MTSAAATVRRVGRTFTEPIESRLETLRTVRFRDLATRFVFGFAVSVLAGLVTLAAGDRAGGLFLAFPAILPASLTLIAKRQGRQEAEVDVSGAVLGAVALVSFAVVSWQLSGRTPLGVTQTLAAVAWLVTASVLYIAVRESIRRRGSSPNANGDQNHQDDEDRGQADVHPSSSRDRRGKRVPRNGTE